MRGGVSAMDAMDTRPDRELLERLRAEEAEPFEGWDFSHLRGRMLEDPLPWDYERLVCDGLPAATSMLDMGTGGGEFLSGLAPLPPYTCATEGYAPNVPIARARLEPLGVRVYEIEDDAHLPLPDDEFDLVINRHETYSPAEVRRILRPGGRFITQQVGGRNNTDLNRLLQSAHAGPPWFDWELSRARSELKDVGLRIDTEMEAFPMTRFTDVGAAVYYLKAISWQMPDFSVERYFDRLRDLEGRLRSEGSIAVRSHRFLLYATKPA